MRRWVDATGALLTRHGIDGTFYYLSDACRAILGYDAEEIVAAKLAAILHPDDAILLATSFGQIPTVRNPGTVTLRVRHRDGTYVWLEVAAGVLTDIAGEPSPQIISVLRPVNDRAEIENHLRRGHRIASP